MKRKTISLPSRSWSPGLVPVAPAVHGLKKYLTQSRELSSLCLCGLELELSSAEPAWTPA